MGEVWRARDTRLGREVAVKVLPDGVADNPQALARFEREARAAAALSHPNILALFDIGEEKGVHFSVAELLEGETLRDTLRRGALPLRRALDIAEQIAKGLAAAHEKGLVHRDVKPENIFITRDGGAKLLDFGLAHDAGPLTDSGDTQSPTVSVLTHGGAVIGTVSYMSPEQARGLPVDHRSDQFSLGIVLYEMLTGTRPFRSNSTAETLTAIIREEPAALEKAAPATPAPVRWLVDRLLAKEASGRFTSTRDLAQDLTMLRLRITEVSSFGSTGTGDPGPALRRRRVVAWAAAALGTIIVALGAGVVLDHRATLARRTPSAPSPTFQRLTSFDGVETWPTLSPDGTTVAYEKHAAGKTDVYALRVGGQNPMNLTTSLEGNCGEPAFSPDGRLIAFRSESGGGGIFQMGATGESVRRLTDFGHTPAWFPDGRRIVVGGAATASPQFCNTDSPLWIVNLDSGERRQIAERGYQPNVSPHGLRIAYWTRTASGGHRDIYTIGTGDTAAGSIVAATQDEATDWSPFWSADGHFLYFASDRNGAMNLWRIAIKEDSGNVQGEPEPVTVPVSWAGPFGGTVGGNRVVFATFEIESILERVPFDAVAEKISGAPVSLARFVTPVVFPRVSPKGDLLTLDEIGSQEDILVMKSDGTGLRTLTDDSYHNRGPNFSPDGNKIVFFSDRSGTYGIWTINVDGSGLTPIARPSSGSILQRPIWSTDGRTIAVADLSWHLRLLSFPRSAADPLPEPCPMPGAGQGLFPHSWSPDSRQLAGYLQNDDGSQGGIVLYDVDKKTYRRVTETGFAPVFLQDGRRIAFEDGNALKIVDIVTGRTRGILEGDPRREIGNFGLAPDGKSIFMFRSSTQGDLWLMDLGAKH
jgi:serine/threonine protein kinase/Tol biopolymer transport system component